MIYGYWKFFSRQRFEVWTGLEHVSAAFQVLGVCIWSISHRFIVYIEEQFSQRLVSGFGVSQVCDVKCFGIKKNLVFEK